MKKKIKLYPAFKYVNEKDWEHLKEEKTNKYIVLNRSMTGDVKLGFFATLETINSNKDIYKADRKDAEVIFNYL